MVKNILKNNKGSSSTIWLIAITIIFSSVTVLLLEMNILYTKSYKIKESVNRAVKSASLAVQENENLANGIFLIDEVTAENNFYQILAHNLGLHETTLEPLESSLVTSKPTIKEFEVINNIPSTYNSTTLGKSYEIENPSVIAIVGLEIKGLLTNKTITVYKLSSSQLTSVFD